MGQREYFSMNSNITEYESNTTTTFMFKSITNNELLIFYTGKHYTLTFTKILFGVQKYYFMDHFCVQNYCFCAQYYLDFSY